jgi:hypothetical protein
MIECQGQSPNHAKTIRSPCSDRSFVSADNEIELHRAKASLPRSDEGVLEHETGDTSTLRRRRRQVSTICDVIAAAGLVCT